jgi:hypothetical protein
MIHGLRGDDDARAEWSAVVDSLGVPADRKAGYGPTLEAIVLLHQGRVDLACERLGGGLGGGPGGEPGEPGAPAPPSKWLAWMWLHWHVALRAEAAVLAARPDARDHVAAAATVVAGNPIGTAIVRRAEALLDHDRERILAVAPAFEAAGCPYQVARTLILAGGDEASLGATALADLGLAPTAS